MSAQRRVKGIIVLPVVQAVRKWCRATGTSPEERMSVGAQRLLQQRVLVSSWYPLPEYMELAEFMYENVMGGKLEAAVQMGRHSGEDLFESAHARFVKKNDPIGTAKSFAILWHMQYDFVDPELVEAVGTVETGHIVYTLEWLDLSEMFATIIVNSMATLLGFAGAPSPKVTLLEKPWEGDDRLKVRIAWGEDIGKRR